MAFLIAIPTHYLTHIFQESVLTITRIVVKGGINQVYIGSRHIGCCLPQPLVTTIALDFTQVPTRRRGAYSYIRLTISWLCLVFFFKGHRNFFFVIGPPAFSATSMYFTDTGRQLDSCFGLGFNSFIRHFVTEVQFSVLAIYLGQDRWP